MRIADGSQTLGETGACLPMHVKTGSGGLCERDHLSGPTVRKAVPAGVVTRLEHDETLRNPGHPLQPVGSPAVTVSVPLCQDSFCRQSGIVPVQRLSHFKTTSRTDVCAS